MNSRISKLADGELKRVLEAELADQNEGLAAFAGYDHALQTFEVKKWMKRMSDLYESVVTLEWAGKYGEKYEKLAEVFMEDTWDLRKSGGPMKTVEYFEAIM